MPSEYFPLWYCPIQPCTEATEFQRMATDRTQVGWTEQEDGTLAVHATTVAQKSPNTVPNILLTWSQIMEGKNIMLGALPDAKYSNNHLFMFTRFYVAMEIHDIMQESHGPDTMARYQAIACRDWYDHNARADVFNLALIDARKLAKCKHYVLG